MSIEIGYKAFNDACDIIGRNFATTVAALMVLAIGGQESKFLARRQIISVTNPDTGKKELRPLGPAVSFWQFERGGGVVGVLTHKSSAALAAKLCKARGVSATPAAVWEAMQTDDVLGAGMARLLLLTDPFRLPEIGKVDEAWKLYTRVWRPGKPHPATWVAAYDAARKVLGV